MRVAGFMLALLLAALPAAAQYNQAAPVPRECKRIVRQLDRYQGDVERARARGNELWETSTLAHMDRLTQRLEGRCPELVPANPVAKFMAKVVDVAAVAAWEYVKKSFVPMP
jgi:hypothetical protein